MTKQYISFIQDTGRIFEVGPEPNLEHQHIEISNDLADKFKSSEYTFSDFVVTYNRTRKKFSVKQVTNTSEELIFRKLKKLQPDHMYDVLLEVDLNKNLCYIKTDDEILDIVNNSNLDFEKQVTFNFTKKNDPHVLYDTVTFEIGSNNKKHMSIKDNYSVFTDNQVADCVYWEIK